MIDRYIDTYFRYINTYLDKLVIGIKYINICKDATLLIPFIKHKSITLT